METRLFGGSRRLAPVLLVAVAVAPEGSID